ncbi:MAG TPA: signal peptidase I [Acidimicrobiales bacterium]|nr:signal peptidase I [Acidimicrobiales bacterium]
MPHRPGVDPMPPYDPTRATALTVDHLGVNELDDVDDVDDDDRLEDDGRLRNIVEWVAIIVGALAVAMVVKTFLIQAFFIPSASMFPTLRDQDRVLVNKLSYQLHDVNRGDLVVFERPPEEMASTINDLVKRVVGLGGEEISVVDGVVLIDGRPLDEPYLKGTTTADMEPVRIPEGHVFVMGDNRGNSSDSRFFGPIDEDLIVGRAFIKVWPLTDLSLL